MSDDDIDTAEELAGGIYRSASQGALDQLSDGALDPDTIHPVDLAKLRALVRLHGANPVAYALGGIAAEGSNQ